MAINESITLTDNFSTVLFGIIVYLCGCPAIHLCGGNGVHAVQHWRPSPIQAR